MKKEVLPVPTLNVNMSEKKENELIENTQITNYLSDVINDINQDREEISGILLNFLELAANLGDSSTSTKEAIVNLMKLKSDTVDKKTKVLDIMLKAWLKENSSPRTVSATQHNEYKIETRKATLLKEIMNGDNNES